MDLVKVLEHHLLDHRFAVLFKIGSIEVSFSKHVLMMWIAAAILLLIAFVSRGTGLVPTRGRSILEIFFIFLRDDIVLPNLGDEGKKYISYFATLFAFILLCNLLGLVPFGSTATGNIAVATGLSLCTFVMIHFAGIREHGVIQHFRGFVPSGLPVWLVPFMFPLELFGIVTKCFALTVRLFANMIAGHILLISLLSFIFLFGKVIAPAIVPFSLATGFAIGCLELFVCFLQAYVFCLLTAVFVGASVHQH